VCELADEIPLKRELQMSNETVGISGLALYVPPYRVDLDAWCDWTGSPQGKIRAVVGRSFRMRGPEHNTYTMAATAALRLIDANRVDPQRLRFLALGTESSTDNSAGAVIVRGMLDDALRARGRPTLARGCEVPEFKHACLGGVYALKSAVRYLMADGRGSQAIVICSDIAEYARGSSGEPTQGAGAVAILLEENPRLAEVHLEGSGSSSDYRGPDFRKPLSRLIGLKSRPNGQIQDLPVFNGKYSTTCYNEATLRSLEDMFLRRDLDAARYFRELEAVFLHRPYRRMPESGWAMGYLFALAHGDERDRKELGGYCAEAAVDLGNVIVEMDSVPVVRDLVHRDALGEDIYPSCVQLLKSFRKADIYPDLILRKMRLGSDLMMDVGNIYTGALFAWLAAGFEHALAENAGIGGKEILLVGYGSGDASEAIPLRIVDDWQRAANRIGFAQALADPVDLDEKRYRQLHDEGYAPGLSHEGEEDFLVQSVGEREEQEFIDAGIEYYRYRGAKPDSLDGDRA
jgi:hydroxymethylglutaryl-CoA synthase